MKASVLTMGEALTDIVIRPGEQPREYPGGSPMNVAVALGRLGHTSHLLTDIGDDARSLAIQEHVGGSSVHLTPGSIKDASATSTAQATIDNDGAATYEFSLSWDPDPAGLPERVNAVHTSSIAATLEPGASTLARIVQEYAPYALISYDPNARPTLMGSPRQVSGTINNNIAHADIVKASDEDIAWLYGDEPLEHIMERWLATGVKLAVVTRGADGASAWWMNGQTNIPGVLVEVADTVGAGDTFSAGLLDALARLNLLGAKHRDALDTLTEVQVRSILEHAALLASVTVSRAGANPPWDTDIDTRTPLTSPNA